MLVKCKGCQEKIDRDIAYKIVINGKNNYYCNEQEYKDIKNKKEIKDNTYLKIYDIFGRKITNTILFKEVNELADIYGYEIIYAYLDKNQDYLSNVMSKDFNNEFGQIRYFSAILKNSLTDFKVENKVVEKKLIVDIPKNNFKPKQRKKSLIEYEMEVGELL